MDYSFRKYINIYFKKLTELYGFRVEKELYEEQSYLIEYRSDCFTIKIEKYFREFYTTLYKTSKPDNEINLFNLLDYLKSGDNAPKSNYFHKEKDIEECYRKQLAFISSVIYDNYDLINIFFYKDNYKKRRVEFEEYWINKHPELYKRK